MVREMPRLSNSACASSLGESPPATPPHPLPFPCSPYLRAASSPGERPLAQTIALAYWSFHYIKRILETFLVHKCEETVVSASLALTLRPGSWLAVQGTGQSCLIKPRH